MKFKEKLKGDLAETLCRAILREAGLTVVPLGIEQVIREVNFLTKGHGYVLPDTLLKLPDYFVVGTGNITVVAPANHDNQTTAKVVDTKAETIGFLEVKYRKKWSSTVHLELNEKISAQLRYFKLLFLIVILGEPHNRGSSDPSDYVRVARIKEVEMFGYSVDNSVTGESIVNKNLKLDWETLYRVEQLFPELSPHHLGLLVQGAKAIRSLDEAE